MSCRRPPSSGQSGGMIRCWGIRTTGIMRCYQPRALDLAAQNRRKLEILPSRIMDEVLARLAPSFFQQ